MASPLRIAIVGEFDPGFRPHVATNAALAHAGAALGVAVEVTWVPTTGLDGAGIARLKDYDGLWSAPGSPYRSFEGALAAIRYAREAGRPYAAT